jgi:hypothetical protein
MVTALAQALPGHRIGVVADAAYAGKELKKLPGQVTWTTRLRKDAALYEMPPAHTGRRGRPRLKGKKLPKLAELACTATFTPTTTHRYGKTATVHTATINCLWYTVFGPQPVTVVLVRENNTSRGYDLALVTTDTHATPDQTVERYASRWAIEVCIEDAKQLLGVGQARNRTARAVERTVPFAPGLPDPRGLLVRHRRPRPRRRRRPPCTPALVHHQDQPLHRRHARQAPPRPHRHQIPPSSTRTADPHRNPRHPPSLGRPSRIRAKLEWQYSASSRPRA